jgi:anti-sigma B factor antagonist
VHCTSGQGRKRPSAGKKTAARVENKLDNIRNSSYFLSYLLSESNDWSPSLPGGVSVRAWEQKQEFHTMSTQPRRQKLEVEDIGDVTVVNFIDKKILDEQNIQIIGEQLFRLVDDLGRTKLLLNFGNVEYLSSAALGKLITLNKKVNSSGGKLILCNIAPNIYEVFEITKLNKILNIQKDEQGGLQAF